VPCGPISTSTLNIDKAGDAQVALGVHHDIVDHHIDRLGVGKVEGGRAHAADLEGGALRRVIGEARRGVLQVGQRLIAAVLQRLSAQREDRDRHILHLFLAALGRDHDLVERGAIILGAAGAVSLAHAVIGRAVAASSKAGVKTPRRRRLVMI
jgi:hypothetical protein